MRSNRSLTVKLKQRKNYIYLLYLAKCYHGKAFDPDIYDAAVKHIEDYFEVYVNDRRSGVIYSTVVNGLCYLDAYKDPTIKSPIKASILAYRDFMLYISKKYDKIYTVNCGNSLLFNFVTRKLGFKFTNTLPSAHKLYEKELHGNRDSDTDIIDSRSSSNSDFSGGECVSIPTSREEAREHSARRRSKSRSDSQRDTRSGSTGRSLSKRRSKKKTGGCNTDDLDNPFGG